MQDSRPDPRFLDAAIRKACHEFGYTQAQVAAATGLHYSSVSKILRKMG
ncbi:helix-turn-helix domain-containing protein [Desulfomicrobium escambiense]